VSKIKGKGIKGGGFPIGGGLVWVVVLLVGLGAAGVFLTESLQPTGTQSSLQNTGETVTLGALAVSGQRADLGRVPLDKMVTHTFRLRNISEEQITVGAVTVKALEGC